MTTTYSLREAGQATKAIPEFRAPDVAQVAEMIREDALALARKKLLPIQRSLETAILLQRSDFFENFKYGLTVGVAEALAANDQHLQAIYAYDPSANPDSESGEAMPLEATIHLVALATASSAALEAYIAALDRALTESLKKFSSPRFALRESILDVNVITEKEVRLGLGYAALLSAVFAPPLKLWEREK